MPLWYVSFLLLFFSLLFLPFRCHIHFINILLQQVEPEKYTFQPYINPATKGMVEAKQSRTGESEGDKYDRLAFGDKQRRSQAKQQLEVFHPPLLHFLFVILFLWYLFIFLFLILNRRRRYIQNIHTNLQLTRSHRLSPLSEPWTNYIEMRRRKSIRELRRRLLMMHSKLRIPTPLLISFHFLIIFRYTFQPQLYSNPYDHIEPKHKVDIR